jgi:hypothetical protein
MPGTRLIWEAYSVAELRQVTSCRLPQVIALIYLREHTTKNKISHPPQVCPPDGTHIDS